ncbi:MAG: iron-sulfur cluster insertion protein ErpA [Mariprofundales bacterium]
MSDSISDSISNPTLMLTAAAATRVHTILSTEAEGTLLRVFVSGGGCSGYQYGFAFDDASNDDDTEITSQGVTLLIDAMSLNLMQGAEIDYKESLQGSSFVIRNPNAATSCGCGNSFTPKENDAGGCAHAG